MMRKKKCSARSDHELRTFNPTKIMTKKTSKRKPKTSTEQEIPTETATVQQQGRKRKESEKTTLQKDPKQHSNHKAENQNVLKAQNIDKIDSPETNEEQDSGLWDPKWNDAELQYYRPANRGKKLRVVVDQAISSLTLRPMLWPAVQFSDDTEVLLLVGCVCNPLLS